MFDQEEYFRRNKWGSIYIPPYRDLREPPEPKPSYEGWKLGALIGVATGLILVIVLGVGV